MNEQLSVLVLDVFIEIVQVQVADGDLADDLISFLFEKRKLVGYFVDVWPKPINVSEMNVGW